MSTQNQVQNNSKIIQTLSDIIAKIIMFVWENTTVRSSLIGILGIFIGTTFNKANPTEIKNFDEKLDKKIKCVHGFYVTENEEQQNPKRVKQLVYVLSQLLDIKYKRIDEIEGRCKGDKDCIVRETNTKNDLVKTLFTDYQIPYIE